MKPDSCSALGCTATAGEDRTIVHLIAFNNDDESEATGTDSGVGLAFCRDHGIPFLRSWAGLASHTTRDDANIYVVTALRADQHRALLHHALADAVENYTGIGDRHTRHQR